MRPLQRRPRLQDQWWSTTETLSPQQAIASELQSYLQSSHLDTEEDPLDKQGEHQRLYSWICGKKHLCILAPLEGFFSVGQKCKDLPSVIPQARKCWQTGVYFEKPVNTKKISYFSGVFL